MVLSSEIILSHDVADGFSTISSLSSPTSPPIGAPSSNPSSQNDLVGHWATKKQSPEWKYYILDPFRPLQGTVGQGWPSQFWKTLGTCSRIILVLCSFLSFLSHIEPVSNSSSQISPTWTTVKPDVPILTVSMDRCDSIFPPREGTGRLDFSRCSSLLFHNWVVYVVFLCFQECQNKRSRYYRMKLSGKKVPNLGYKECTRRSWWELP